MYEAYMLLFSLCTERVPFSPRIIMSTCGMEDNNSVINKDNHVKSNACFCRKHRWHLFEMRGCTYQVQIMDPA